MNPFTFIDRHGRSPVSDGDGRHQAPPGDAARRCAAALAALGGRRFRNAAVIGCDLATIAQALEPCCDALVRVDQVAPASPRSRGVSIPGGVFDLIVLSGLLRFLSLDRLYALAWRCGDRTSPGATILIVSGLAPGETAIAAEVAALTFLEALGDDWACDNLALTQQYRLDVAQRLGMAPG